jgi:hypothetical protein
MEETGYQLSYAPYADQWMEVVFFLVNSRPSLNCPDTPML